MFGLYGWFLHASINLRSVKGLSILIKLGYQLFQLLIVAQSFSMLIFTILGKRNFCCRDKICEKYLLLQHEVKYMCLNNLNLLKILEIFFLYRVLRVWCQGVEIRCTLILEYTVSPIWKPSRNFNRWLKYIFL